MSYDKNINVPADVADLLTDYMFVFKYLTYTDILEKFKIFLLECDKLNKKKEIKKCLKK